MPAPVLLDDRLLVEEVLAGLPGRVPRDRLLTTSLWYFRASRAAVLGAGGRLSGPFHEVSRELQQDAVAEFLQLPASIGLPDPRWAVPSMARAARRHPRLNLMNLEVVAVAAELGAAVWLSPPAAQGVLPGALDADGIRWRAVRVPGW